MSNIFVKTKGIESWQELLVHKEKQWKIGYSAKALANAWESNEGFPREIQEIFDASNDEFIRKIKFLFGFPEYEVKIPGGGKTSQNDLYVFATSQNKPLCIMVEGKVNEDFGPLVSKWVETASCGWENQRLRYLVDLLKLQDKAIEDVRYQLLHRTASALIEADRVGTDKCMVIIHSFSQKNAHFDDYRRFIEMFGVTPEVNKICSPVKINSKQVYFLWAVGDEKYKEL